MMIARVKLEHGPYTGEVVVFISPDDDDEIVIAKAWAAAQRRGWLTLGQAASSAKVIERKEV